MVKKLPTDAGDTRDASSIPGLGRSLGGGNGNPLQYSCLENSVDRDPWTKEPSRLHSMELQRVGQDSTHARTVAFYVL